MNEDRIKQAIAVPSRGGVAGCAEAEWGLPAKDGRRVVAHVYDESEPLDGLIQCNSIWRETRFPT